MLKTTVMTTIRSTTTPTKPRNLGLPILRPTYMWGTAPTPQKMFLHGVRPAAGREVFRQRPGRC